METKIQPNNQQGFTPLEHNGVMSNSLVKRTTSVQKNSALTGFTLIEILVVMGLIAVLAGIVLVAINPNRQFAQGRNAHRWSDTNAILNAISQNIADNKGIFTCGTSIPSSDTIIKKSGGADLRSCLVPTYISELPIDPSGGSAFDSGSGNYDSGYQVAQDTTTKRITVKAPSAELQQQIQITR